MKTFEEHAIEDFNNKALPKYRAGKREHGQGLDDLPLIDVARESFGEVIDQWFYIYRLRDGIEQIDSHVRAIQLIRDDPFLTARDRDALVHSHLDAIADVLSGITRPDSKRRP